MKTRLLLSTFACLGFSGCSDVVSDPAENSLPGIVTAEDVGSEPKIAIEEIERPELVTEGPLPQAVALKTEYSFGRMALGSHGETTFEISNEGEGVLQLKAGKATCQCTTFALSEEMLQPGATATLTVNWHANKVDSNFRHGGPVLTSDPERPELRFVVMGKIGIEYELQPAEIWNAGEATKETPAKVSGVLFSSVNSEFEIERIESTSDSVSTESVALSGSELSEVNGLAGYRIDVSVPADFPPGETEQTLSVYVAGRKEPIGLTVKARRTGPIRILPTPGVFYEAEKNRLSLGTFDAAKGKSASVLLLVKDLKEPLKLSDVQSSPAYLSAELEPVGSGIDRYRLTVTAPEGMRRVARGTKKPVRLKLETNHPVQQFIELDVTFKAS